MAQKALSDIEDEIIALSKQDANHWAQMAQLMITVQNEKLYSDGHASFTQWVRSLADRAKVHESLLWRRLKAGNYYLKLKSRAPSLPDMNTVKISPDNFVLIKDIVGNNFEEGRKLIQKVLDGTLTRKDLTAAKAAVLKQREAAGIKRAANGYESRALEQNLLGSLNSANSNVNEDNDISIKDGITAAKILLTIQGQTNWLSESIDTVESTESEKYMREKYKSIYRVLSEFPVETGDAKHVRRIDAFVIENITSHEPKDMTLIGIEIKISKGDLLRDEKMSEYTNYCDYFYIAVPPELEADARSIISPDWGILLINGGNIEDIEDDEDSEDSEEIIVAKKAEKLNAILRWEALSTALYEVL